MLLINSAPLDAISTETRNHLAEMLNRKKLFLSGGYQRDWRGIARLAGVYNFIDDNVGMPMNEVITTWIQHKPETATMGNLQDFLCIIDRWDVFDDIQENLARDIANYNQEQERRAALEQCRPTSRGNSLSIEDVQCRQNGVPLPKYDALVLYAEKDKELAENIINKLEAAPHRLKLFSKARDILPGSAFEHVQLSEFMETRCNKLLVVLTNEFLKSGENIFLVNITQKYQIESNMRKIIPVVCSKMKIPRTLDIYTHLKYGQESTHFNFWDRLASSLIDSNTTFR